MRRYQRQIALPEIGISGQQKLGDAKVLVIGAGGLGCPVLQNLVAAGVGCIGIVDGDVIEESNLHRQYLYTLKDCGQYKAIVAAAMLSEQNPDLSITAFPDHFSISNAFDITEDYHLIVDCTDNIESRYLINDVALVRKIPMVYASIHKFEGQLSVFNYEAGPTYRCLFPQRTEEDGMVNCNDAGVLGVLPGTLGVLQATEVLKIILGIGEVLSGKLLLYNGLLHKMNTVSFEKNALEVQNGLLNGLEIMNRKKKEVKVIRAIDFLEETVNPNALIIDLREDYEGPRLAIAAIRNIPMDRLENYLENYDKNQKIVLFCQYGNKSVLAAEYLMKSGFSDVNHLHSGVDALAPIPS